jgi:small nuclear ribonucleoprotein (snRNP)-like protein
MKLTIHFQPEPSSKADSPGRQKLRSWLNKNLKIEMTDGRVLVGIFLCTDRDANVILGSCSEYLQPDGKLHIGYTLCTVTYSGMNIQKVN